MIESNFYVEAARNLAVGLAAMGTTTPSPLPRSEGVFSTAGWLVGCGFNDTESDVLVNATKWDDSLLRKCAYIALTFHSPSANTMDALRRGFTEKDKELQKVAIIGYGLTRIGSQEMNYAALALQDSEWKVRAAAGLALSSTLIQNGNPWPMVERLQKEQNPYVKVCSCWQVSLAHVGTRGGFDDYKELLSWHGDGNSFFRDMACLGLGLSYWGKCDDTPLSLLLEGMRDPHPYVRESACFGIALLFSGSGDNEISNLLKKATKDESSVVRTGASLGLGILRMGMPVDSDAPDQSDESVLWGTHVGRGLQLGPPLPIPESTYARWGYYIGRGLKPCATFDTPAPPHESCFFSPIQQGMRQVPASKNVAALRLIVPALFHYLLYDSFWWGLWVLAAMGQALKVEK